MSELTESFPSAETQEPAARKGFGVLYTRYTLGLLVLVSLFNAVDRSILAVLIEPIKHDLQLSDLQLGLISGVAFSLFYAILGIPFARWADVGSRRTLLTLTVGLWSIMTVLCGCAQNFIQLFLARMGVGIGEAGGSPAALSLLGDIYSPKRRGFATALFMVGGILGTVIGMWGGAVIATEWGWRTAFVAMGLPGVMLALLLKTTLREPRQDCRLPSLSETFGQDAIKVVRQLFSKSSYFHCVVGFTLFGIFSAGSAQWNISYIVRSFDISIEEAGAMFGVVVGGASVLGTLFGGYIANRIGSRSPLGYLYFSSILMLLSVPPFIFMYATDSIYSVLVMYALAMLMIGAVTPCIYACIFGISGAKHRALGIAGISLFASLIGGGVGPLIIGALSDFLSPSYGEQSLGMALMVSIGFIPFAVFHFYRASKTLLEDFEDPSDG